MIPHLKKIINDFHDEKSGNFVFDFMETAVSKDMMSKIKKVFNTEVNKNIKLFINSVIPEE